MAVLQAVNLLACPPNAPFSPQPTIASPCPVVSVNSQQIQGTSIYSNAANTAGNCEINYTWKVNNQFCSGTLIVSQTQAAIIAAS